MNDLVSRLRRLAFHAKHLADTESLHALYREAFQRCEANETEAAAEIERIRQQVAYLRAERDEARREACELDSETHGGALLEAERRGWDCFAGNTSEHM